MLITFVISDVVVAGVGQFCVYRSGRGPQRLTHPEPTSGSWTESFLEGHYVSDGQTPGVILGVDQDPVHQGAYSSSKHLESFVPT